MLMVTSGAVAFGKQKLKAEMRMAMSMRETLSQKGELGTEVSIFINIFIFCKLLEKGICVS